jgi:hypothetical protein
LKHRQYAVYIRSEYLHHQRYRPFATSVPAPRFSPTFMKVFLPSRIPAQLALPGSCLVAAFGTHRGETLTGVVGGPMGTIKLLVGGRSEYKIRPVRSIRKATATTKNPLVRPSFQPVRFVRVTDVVTAERTPVGVIQVGNTNAEMVMGGALAYRRYLSDQRFLLGTRSAAGPPCREPDTRSWHHGIGGPHGAMGEAVSTADTPVRVPALRSKHSIRSACGSKSRIAQMTSCARRFICVLQSRTSGGDGDGVPCEKICG